MNLLQRTFVFAFLIFCFGYVSIYAQGPKPTPKKPDKVKVIGPDTAVVEDRADGAPVLDVLYTPLVNEEKVTLTVKLLSSKLTSVRVSNASFSKDTTVENLQERMYIEVKLKNGKNVFYVDGFTKDDRINGKKVEIEREDAPTVNAAVVAQQAPPPTQPTAVKGAADPPPTPAKSPAKLRLFGEIEVANRATTIVKVDRTNLDSQYGKYVVEVTNGGKTEKKEVAMELEKPEVGKIKTTQSIEVALLEGKNKVTIYPKVGGKDQTEFGENFEITCLDCTDSPASASTRFAVGFEQIGASSTKSKQNPFLDFYFDTPFIIPFTKKWVTCLESDPACEVTSRRKSIDCLESDPRCDAITKKKLVDCLPSDPACDKITRQKRVPDKKFNFSVWGSLRFGSIPVQTLVSFSNISAFQTFLQEDKNKSNALAQSFDFMVGLETKLPLLGNFGRGFLPGKSSMYVIAGAGAINPIAPDQTAQVFKIPMINNAVDPSFLELFPEAKGKKNIAFVSPLRDHFFRQYFAGIRMKTHFFDGVESRPKNLFPAIVDLTFGQNEAITGSLRGIVMRLDGSTPFPIKGLDFLYLFGSTQLRLGKKVNERLPSFFLEQVDSNTVLTSPDTVIVPIDRYPQTISNRDIFRMGIGVDFFKLFKQDKKE